jgi:hypothetical protein
MFSPLYILLPLRIGGNSRWILPIQHLDLLSSPSSYTSLPKTPKTIVLIISLLPLACLPYEIYRAVKTAMPTTCLELPKQGTTFVDATTVLEWLNGRAFTYDGYAFVMKTGGDRTYFCCCYYRRRETRRFWKLTDPRGRKSRKGKSLREISQWGGIELPFRSSQYASKSCFFRPNISQVLAYASYTFAS